MGLLAWHGRRLRTKLVASVVLVTFSTSLSAPVWAAVARADADESLARDARLLRDHAGNQKLAGTIAGGELNERERARDQLKPSVVEPPAPEGSADTVPPEALPNLDQQVALAADNAGGGDRAISGQAVNLPGLGGSLGESYSADLTTGNMMFSVPLGVATARGSAQPSLALSYCSNCGSSNVGTGWSLGVPAITRQTDRGGPRYADPIDNRWYGGQDRFEFGGSELVPVCTVSANSCVGARPNETMPTWANGWQYFRTRVDSFQRIFWSPDHRTWRVQAKDGSGLEFGVPLDGSKYEAALEQNPQNPAEVFRWYLARAYDSHGDINRPDPRPVNVAVYRYSRAGGVASLTEIFDTPPASTPTTTDLSLYANHTVLEYEYRPDVATSYRAGFLQRMPLRLKRVSVAVKPFSQTTLPRQLLRRYHLAYAPGLHNSVLASIELEGRCAAAVVETNQRLPESSACPRLPPTRFGYVRVDATQGSTLADSAGLSFEGFATSLERLGNSPPNSLIERGTELMDVNNDGLLDVLVTSPLETGDAGHVAYLNGESSDGSIWSLGFGDATRMPILGSPGIDSNVLNLGSVNVSPMDADGDGLLDLVHMPRAKKYDLFSPQATVNGLVWQGRTVELASDQDVRIDFSRDSRRTAVADVNADGLADVVVATATEYQTFFALGRYPGGDGRFGTAAWTGPASANISAAPVTACVPDSAGAVLLGDPGVQFAEMNGDGLPDLVLMKSGLLHYWPGRGNGTWGTADRNGCEHGRAPGSTYVAMAQSPRFGIVSGGTLQLNDLNGDGLSDLIEVKRDGVDVYLNDNGIAWSDRYTIATETLTGSASMVRLVDINGSGTPDILWGEGYDYRYVDLTGGVRPFALASVDNSLGKTITFEYSTSAAYMIAAKHSGNPWTATMALNVPVVKSSTVSDNLQRIGRQSGNYVTQYEYRDPLYEGRQRDFRGFQRASTIIPGETLQDTSIVENVFRLAECVPLSGIPDTCGPQNRWRDLGLEALHGTPRLVETRSADGVYHSSSHQAYEVRQLYTGLDGRLVTALLPTRSHQLSYDTYAAAGASSGVTVAVDDLRLPGSASYQSYALPVRVPAGKMLTKTETDYDDFGNAVEHRALGCVDGCTDSGANEVATVRSAFSRPAGDTSGWLWVATDNERTGSLHAGRTVRNRAEYNAFGDALKTYGLLSGSLPLIRTHETAGAPVAGQPANASGGTSTAVEVTLSTVTVDQFGNMLTFKGPNGSCSGVNMDAQYATLPIKTTEFVGATGSDGCGTTPLASTATFDRGLQRVLDTKNAHNVPNRYAYDGFGRLTSVLGPNPANPTALASRVSASIEYRPTIDPITKPYSIVITRKQDGPLVTDSQYHETWDFVDGLGRRMATLREADRSAGDTGDYIVSGATGFDAKGAAVRTYDSWWHLGTPTSFNLAIPAATQYSSRLIDAFGRTTAEYGLDGKLTYAYRYHAASVDHLDVTDIEAGPGKDTFATTYSDGHGRDVLNVVRTKFAGSSTISEIRLRKKYLPTGEIEQLTREATGKPTITRWLRYDTLGRLVLNVEPNTSPNFTTNINIAATSVKAWRYAYNDSGQLVGTSDARGCGVNYYYDAGGRVVATDLSPCLATQPAYTPPDLTTGSGTESFFRYDSADPDAATAIGADGTALPSSNFLLGSLTAISDRAQKTLFAYDALTRTAGLARRIVKPGTPSATLSSRYAERWYVSTLKYDAADRITTETLGNPLAAMNGPDGTSRVLTSYTRRGVVRTVDSSYGVLLAKRTFAADGRILTDTYGDAAATARLFEYDERKRLQHAMTYRSVAPLWSSPPAGYTPGAPNETTQLLLEDTDFEYDGVDDLKAIHDFRTATEWPAGAKPVTRLFETNDLHRVTKVTYQYPGGSDSWTPPFNAENNDPTRLPRPGPQVSFPSRVKEQTFAYDHRGNITLAKDDTNGFWDRSIGTQTFGTATAGPDQLRTATNRTLTPAGRTGALRTAFDAAGNMTGLIVERDGACLPSGASCWQRFVYQWDEVGNLASAQRWDLTEAERSTHAVFTVPPPPRAADANLGYAYDHSGGRVLKTSTAAAESRYTAYVSSAVELRSVRWVAASNDYELSGAGVALYLGGVGKVAFFSDQLLPVTNAGPRLVLNIPDQLGSNGIIIDHQTGELIERSTHQAYGAPDSDYRPARWGEYREPYAFAGKESDIEVGLTYFGARYYAPALGRWISADPLTIHGLGSDANPYAYVAGRVGSVVDADGRVFPILAAIAVAAAVGYAANAIGQAHAANWDWSTVQWGWSGGQGALAAGVTAGVGAAITVVAAPLAPMLAPTLGPGLAALVPGIAGGVASGGLGAGLAGAGVGGIAAGMFVGGLSGLGGGAGSALAAKAGGGAALQAVGSGLGGATAGLSGQAMLGQSPTLGDAGFQMALGVGASLASQAAQAKPHKQAPKPNAGEASEAAAGKAKGGPSSAPPPPPDEVAEVTGAPPPPAAPPPKDVFDSQENWLRQQKAYAECGGNSACAAGVYKGTAKPANDNAGAKPANDNAKPLHNNSLNSTKPAVGYVLRDVDTGEIVKYGETTQKPTERYSRRLLREMNARLVVEATGTKRDMHTWQHERIVEYKAAHGGARPKYNYNDY
jgi:RHS repeat-associated protein